MKRTRLLLPVSALGFLSVTAFAWSRSGLERHAASWIKTEFEEGDVAFTIVNRRWSFLSHCWPDETYSSVLLLEEFKSKQRLNMDLGMGTVRVTAWFGKNTRPTHKMWTIEHEGEEGKLTPDSTFYRITYDNGCDWPVHYYYDLVHGRNVYTTTEDLLEIGVIESSLHRYIGYRYTTEAVPAVYEAPKENIPFGIIQYGTDSAVMQRVALCTQHDWMVRHADKVSFLHQNEPEESPLLLFDVRGREDRAALSGFSLVISFSRPEGQVIIPIENDCLDVNNATIPSGFNLQSVE